MKLSPTSRLTLAAVALTFATHLVTPQKANAGIVLYALGKHNTEFRDDVRHALQVFGIVFFIVGLFGSWQYIVLDAETSEDILAQQIKKQYPVLADQTAVVNKLAREVIREGQKTYKANPNNNAVVVKLSAEKVRGILSEVVSNDAQALEAIVTEFSR